MISLRKTMTELEGLSQQFQTALDCYRAALGSMEEHAVAITPEGVAEHRQTLRLIRKALEECSSEESLVGSRAALEAELERYSKRAAGALKGREGEIRAILEILAQAAQAMTAHSDNYSTRFRSLAHDL
ncbi:MAG TPA: hypothetical protein VLH09_04220, partial [Bryobacteraceae bacterium]|nr:hypothetical protein [Bryobacteraceae bacterium]